MESAHRCRACSAPLTKKPGPGRWPHWCKGCKPRARRAYKPSTTHHQCSLCGATLRTSWLPQPVCRGCYKTTHTVGDDEATRRARRRQAARRLARAAEGTRSARVWTQGECNWCGDLFTAVGTGPARWCSDHCDQRAARQRRTTAKAGGTGWRWSDFMRMAAKFGYCCAYCGTKPNRLDPDHVVPLARGGDDSLSNLLPTCLACNSDKRDLLLDEWRHDRARRGQPARNTQSTGDSRYSHLALTVSVRARSTAA